VLFLSIIRGKELLKSNEWEEKGQKDRHGVYFSRRKEERKGGKIILLKLPLLV